MATALAQEIKEKFDANGYCLAKGVQLYSGQDRMEALGRPDERTVLRGWSHVATQSYCGRH